MLTAYYHVAALGHWRSVFSEQIRLLHAWRPELLVRIGFTGSRDEVGFIWRTAHHRGLNFEVMFDSSGNHCYEFPTLGALKKHCDDGLEGNVLYLHTKGVSHGGDWLSTMWRWLMNAWMFRDESIEVLADHPWTSTTIHPLSSKIPAFPCGNFWAATTNHIRALPDPYAFWKEFMTDKWLDSEAPSWLAGRIAAEMWLGTVNNGAPKELLTPTFAISQSQSFINNVEIQDFATKHGS